jgi:hypothetical protein
MNFIVSLLAFSLAGCSYTTYENGPVKVFRISLGNDILLNRVQDVSKGGEHSVKIGIIDNNQSEAIKGAVNAAIDAAMKGL